MRCASNKAGCVAWTRSQRWGAAGFALRQIAFVPNAGAMWAYFVTLRVRPLRWGADGKAPSLQALLRREAEAVLCGVGLRRGAGCAANHEVALAYVFAV